MRQGTLLLLLLCFVAVVARSTASAEAPAADATAIYVEDMCCANCAKRIARKLYVIPGVVAVHADVKQGIALVTPQQTKRPSPRAMWEAVEGAEFVPVKLLGPAGEFTQKPPH